MVDEGLDLWDWNNYRAETTFCNTPHYKAVLCTGSAAKSICIIILKRKETHLQEQWQQKVTIISILFGIAIIWAEIYAKIANK